MPLVLALGTALSGLGYLLAGASGGFGCWCRAPDRRVGSSAQHPLASALVARAFAGPRSMKALGTYNFAGDIGKMTVPAAASLMLVVMPWQPVWRCWARSDSSPPPRSSCSRRGLPIEPRRRAGRSQGRCGRAPAASSRFGFPMLLAIGMIDSATRMGFLIFLPFVLLAKGASLPTVGLALTLVFAGGAAGKLVCAFIGARIGVIATVCLTEGLTTLGILALLPLPLEAALIVLPVIGVMLNGTSSVLYGSVPELVEPAGARACSASSTPARSVPARSRPRSMACSAMRWACRPR